jgi:uncharacterized membrane-anchored protein
MENAYKRYIWFAIGAIFFLGITVLLLSMPYLTGKTYIFKTIPVDPFDVFRGQYIAIQYDISRLNNSIGITGVDVGRELYVSLAESKDSTWKATGISFKKQRGDFIRGTIENADESNVFIQYGIEQYFFERDAEFSTINLTVEAKIGSSGQARITRLLKDGAPIEIKYIDQQASRETKARPAQPTPVA